MQSATGRWVSGEDFFGRERELEVLGERVRDGNHVLLTGQRRVGKTSIARELGRILEDEGWIFLLVDVEAASGSEDVVAMLAQAIHPIRPIASRLRALMRQFVGNLEEVSAAQVRVKVRAGLTAGSWPRHGEELLRACEGQDRRVLIVLDELPIFLSRLLREDSGDGKRVDEFLSWLRGVFQTAASQTVVLMVSGSIGLAPLVGRLGMSDRINYLHPFRVAPWSRETSVACFERLAASYGVALDGRVAETAYAKLGLGIPHHVQSFFVHLRDDARMRGVEALTLEAVERVYQTSLLGPWGQNDVQHYATRLQDHLDEFDYRVAMEVLTEAATQGAFAPSAREALETSLGTLHDKIPARVAAVLDVLEYDGYLKGTDGGHRFESALLRDWWRARFERGHVPLERRLREAGELKR